MIHSFVTSTVSKHALNLIFTELRLIVPFGQHNKNGVRPKLQHRLSHAARLTSKLTFCLFNSILNIALKKQIKVSNCDPLDRLFADSTPVATQSPIKRFHTTQRRPYNEMAAMLVFQTNPVGVELFSYVNTFFFPSLLLELPNINERSAVKGSNHPMVLFTPDAATVSRNRSHTFWHLLENSYFK